jgi:hypothetical protein
MGRGRRVGRIVLRVVRREVVGPEPRLGLDELTAPAAHDGEPLIASHEVIDGVEETAAWLRRAAGRTSTQLSSPRERG